MTELTPESVSELLTRFEEAIAAGSVGQLAQLCVTDPSLVVYDQDGYLYRSRAHWALRPSTPRTLSGAERGVHIDGRAGWVTYESANTYRTTLVLVDEDHAGWRIAHLHVSPATPGPRPGGI